MSENPKKLRIIGNNAIVMTKSDFKSQMEDVKGIAKMEVTLPFAWSEKWNTLEADHYLFMQGKDNKFPQNLKKILAKSPIYKVGLQYSAIQLAGLGIQTGEISLVEDKEVFLCTKNTAWKDYMKRSSFVRNYYGKACRALKTYNMAYVHIVLSAAGTIANATVLPNTRCRLYGNTLTGKVHFCVVADWEKMPGISVDTTNALWYPIIDCWYDTAETFRSQVAKYPDQKEFIYVLSLPSDDLIYNIPDHYTLVESGLLDYANNIVNFKKWVMENLTTLNQIMFVSEEYMASRYPEWKAWQEQAERGGVKGTEAATKIDNAYNELATLFQASASGVEKSGKMVQAPMFAGGEESIKIVKVEQNTFDQQYNEDANWVEKQIHWALMIDAGLYSTGEGKNNNGGSAKTQTFNIAQVNEWMFEQVLLEIPQFISDYNRFGVDTFMVKRATMYSSDAVSPTDRHTANPSTK